MRIFRRSRSRSDSRVKAEQEPAPRKRILVIGSEGHGRDVVAYAWDRFPEDFNVADYDVVILNFASFDQNPELAAGFPPERLPDRDSLGRLFFAEGAELIAIGDPTPRLAPSPKDLATFSAAAPSTTGYRSGLPSRRNPARPSS
jgi:hypothetical protein